MFGHRVTPLRRYLFAQEGVDCLAQALAGCHAVINLAGAPIDRRWTDAYKRELVESRIMTTRKLVEAVNRLHEPPGVMISASAVGYYGSAVMGNWTIRKRIPFWRNCAWPGKRRPGW